MANGLVTVGNGALLSQVAAELERDARRFLSKVAPRDNGCWEWVGAIQDSHQQWRKKFPGAARNWRGRFWFRGRAEYAHRVSWIIFRGEIEPTSLVVMHSECDNSICANPWHLGLGTCQENMWDMMAKGRGGGWARPAGDSLLFLPFDEQTEEPFSVF